MSRVIFLAMVFLLPFAGTALAGEYNQTLNIGDASPAWEKLPGVDGKTYSLADLKDKEVIVVAFTCISCETAVEYEDRINELAKKYDDPKSKVGVLAICSSRAPGDKLEKLSERATKKPYLFPLAYDESQKVAKDFGAIATPEFYVLNKDRKIVYMGAMDDVTAADKVTIRYVEDAIAAALSGQLPVVKETLARGCRIRYVRERK